MSEEQEPSIGETGQYTIDADDPELESKLLAIAMREVDSDHSNEFIAGALSALQFQNIVLRSYAEHLHAFCVTLGSQIKFPVLPFDFNTWSEIRSMTEKQKEEYFAGKQKEYDEKKPRILRIT